MVTSLTGPGEAYLVLSQQTVQNGQMMSKRFPYAMMMVDLDAEEADTTFDASTDPH